MAENQRKTMYIGTSGYQYNHWKGVFYPDDMPEEKWFQYYIRHFDTVEINNTFYNLPSKNTFRRWRGAAPAGFTYVVKYSRYGSHLKKLKDPHAHASRFMDRASCLGETLGAILVQLPPKWKRNTERLDEFLNAAPADVRWVVEFRDESWLCDEVYRALRDHNATLCIHDMIPDHAHEVTSDLVYLRFHGKGYGGSYTEEQLQEAAARIMKHVEQDRSVFAYFNNDAEGWAVRNALRLKELCK